MSKDAVLDAKEKDKAAEIPELTDEFARELLTVLKPSVLAVDQQLRQVLSSQEELGRQVQALGTVLATFETKAQVPALSPYSRSLKKSGIRLKKVSVMVDRINARVEAIRTIIRKNETAKAALFDELGGADPGSAAASSSSPSSSSSSAFPSTAVPASSNEASPTSPHTPPTLASLLQLLDWDEAVAKRSPDSKQPSSSSPPASSSSASTTSSSALSSPSSSASAAVPASAPSTRSVPPPSLGT
eukprot:g47552.t1